MSCVILIRMCGIFAYTGNKNATEVLLDGLTTLEYRGYDSAGMYIPGRGAVKTPGAVGALREKIPTDFTGNSGIAHLRWATHGEPTEHNAHPHHSCREDVWVVHNGIIENFVELKESLVTDGCVFDSDTDTEVVAHLIERELRRNGGDIEQATRSALRAVRGTYGIAIMGGSDPSRIIAARMGAPLVLGLGDGECFIASDTTPILRHTRNVVFLEDGDVVIMTPGTHTITTLDATTASRPVHTLLWNPEEAQKGGYAHFMEKEIAEGPDVVRNALRGRLCADEGTVKLGGIERVAEKLHTIERLVIVGCGTALYAGMVGEYMLEEYVGIPVEVEPASEFRYRSTVLNSKTAVLAISQSGETADTLEAIREAKRHGALTLGIVNTVGSTIAREVDAGIYNHAGPEISVASTKAFISQVTVLALFTVFLGRQRFLSVAKGMEIVRALEQLPELIEQVLTRTAPVSALAKKYAHVRDFLYIGRRYNYPIALEGALKLKEVSYVHAEGYGAGEMKHGPIAMIDASFPTLAVAPSNSMYEKMLSNIQQIHARRGPVVAIATDDNHAICAHVDDVLYIPKTIEMLEPILAVVPMQMFAYHMAIARDINPDRPRNLAKSVTVE